LQDVGMDETGSENKLQVVWVDGTGSGSYPMADWGLLPGCYNWE